MCALNKCSSGGIFWRNSLTTRWLLLVNWDIIHSFMHPDIPSLTSAFVCTQMFISMHYIWHIQHVDWEQTPASEAHYTCWLCDVVLNDFWCLFLFSRSSPDLRNKLVKYNAAQKDPGGRKLSWTSNEEDKVWIRLLKSWEICKRCEYCLCTCHTLHLRRLERLPAIPTHTYSHTHTRCRVSMQQNPTVSLLVYFRRKGAYCSFNVQPDPVKTLTDIPCQLQSS